MYQYKQIISKAKKASLYSLSALLLVASVAGVIAGNTANAATLTQSFVRFDRMKISTATTGTVCAKTATVGSETQVQVTFPTGYTLGTAGNFTTSTTNLAWPATASAWPTIQASATSVAGQVVTWTSGDLTANTLYCFNWTNSAAVTVASGASSNNTGTIATNLDSASFSTASIADDQIAVSASVPQSFSFALSANTDALGNLSTASVATSPTPRTVTVNTNSASGWMVWARDANTGLTSPTASYTVASTTPGSNSTLVAGTEGYNFGVTTGQTGGSGTLTTAAPFVGSGTGQGGGLDTSLRTIVTSNGTANNAVLTLKNNVAISATTTAATDYADTITVVGAGLF